MCPKTKHNVWDQLALMGKQLRVRVLPAEVFSADDVLAAGCGDEDAALVDDIFNGRHFVTFHRSLGTKTRLV